MTRKERAKTSLLTCAWIALLILAAFKARGAFNVLIDWVGREGIGVIVWSTFAVFFAAFIYIVCRARALSKGSVALFVIGLLYALSFDIAEERIHLIKYGILGILVARDNFAHFGRRSILPVVLMGSAVAIADETVQFALPDRVGDLRDVLFGVIGSFWGGAMYIMQNHQQSASSLKKI